MQLTARETPETMRRDFGCDLFSSSSRTMWECCSSQQGEGIKNIPSFEHHKIHHQKWKEYGTTAHLPRECRPPKQGEHLSEKQLRGLRGLEGLQRSQLSWEILSTGQLLAMYSPNSTLWKSGRKIAAVQSKVGWDHDRLYSSSVVSVTGTSIPLQTATPNWFPTRRQYNLIQSQLPVL